MSTCRVLIVEDDPILSAHLETIVTQAIERSDVIISAAVAEAERIARDVAPDVVFLDVDVLDGTTYAFASTLDDRRIPFAFVSASDRDDIPPALRSAAFVAKPYAPHDIVGLLHAAGKIPV